MKRQIASFFAGIGVAVLIGVGLTTYRHREQIAQRGRDIAKRGRRIAKRGQQIVQQFRPQPDIDLNGCPTEQLVRAGIDREMADRIVESRPYRSKLELIERVMLPNDVYALIKNRVWVSGANEPVKVAG